MTKIPAIFAAIVLVLMVSRCCLGDDWVFIGLDEQPVATSAAKPVEKKRLMGVAGHVYSDGCWRADLTSPDVEQHDVELFRAINSRHWNAEKKRIEWTAPTWDGAHGGWQPGKKAVKYLGRFTPKKRVICNGTNPPTCRQVTTWEF